MISAWHLIWIIPVCVFGRVMDDCLISKSLARVEKLLTQAAAARDTEDFLHYLNNARQIVLSLRVVLDAEKDDGR